MRENYRQNEMSNICYGLFSSLIKIDEREIIISDNLDIKKIKLVVHFSWEKLV